MMLAGTGIMPFSVILPLNQPYLSLSGWISPTLMDTTLAKNRKNRLLVRHLFLWGL